MGEEHMGRVFRTEGSAHLEMGEHGALEEPCEVHKLAFLFSDESHHG